MMKNTDTQESPSNHYVILIPRDLSADTRQNLNFFDPVLTYYHVNCGCAPLERMREQRWIIRENTYSAKCTRCSHVLKLAGDPPTRQKFLHLLSGRLDDPELIVKTLRIRGEDYACFLIAETEEQKKDLCDTYIRAYLP